MTLVNVCDIELTGVDWALLPLMVLALEKVGVPQVYEVPAGTTPLVVLAGTTLNALPEQMVWFMARIAGLGLTVMI